MKAFNSILILLFALLNVCLAVHPADTFPNQAQVDKDNYEAMTLAAAKKGVQLQHGKRYAFSEKWAPAYGEYMCLPDYSHVRLIVGQFFNSPTRAGRQAFDGKAFEMISNEAETYLGQAPKGGTVHSQVDNLWWANHYFNEKKQEWVKVSKESKYEYLGETSATDAYITNQGISKAVFVAYLLLSLWLKFSGLAYAREWPKYNLLTNNCMEYTKEVWKNIH
jgi:hypothetical protein